MIIMDFWQVKIGLNFKSPFEIDFLLFKKYKMFNQHILKIFTLTFIHMDFMGILFKISLDEFMSYATTY
jgi:hypothetical protein